MPNFTKKGNGNKKGSIVEDSSSSGIIKGRDGKSIAIVGMACRFPGADNYNEYWSNLEKGIDSIKEIPADRWDTRQHYSPIFEEPNKSISKWCGLVDDIDKFDNRFFNISPREANNMDPQQRLLMEETWHCIEDSGVALDTLQQKTTSIYMGVGSTDYQNEFSAPGISIDSYSGIGDYGCILANRISYFFGLMGASMTVNAACASSLVAIHQARQSLVNNESDYAISGGVSISFHPLKYISFSKSRMLSPDGKCKTFDIEANGYVRGEGIGVILMQRLEDALNEGNRIYGIVKGSAVNHGGRALSITAPRVEAQKEVILTAYKDAEINPETISYIEAHGTGTSLGDPIEVESLTRAFSEFSNKKQFCKIGSVKTNIGHLEAAAGAAGLIKVLLMMRHQKIPQSLNIRTLNPVIDFKNTPFVVARKLSEWPLSNGNHLRRAGVSSFGFGGVNSHIVIEEYKDDALTKPAETDTDRMFLLSAKSENSLKMLIEDWKLFVKSKTYKELSLNDICATLIKGRESFAHRWGAHLHNTDDLGKYLEQAIPSVPANNKKHWCLRIGDFSFDGIARFNGYLEQFDLYRQHIGDVIRCYLKTNKGKAPLRDLQQEIWDEENKPLYSFMIVYAGISALVDLGLTPDVVTGEKAGVFIGLVISGSMELEDALLVLSKQKELSEVQFGRPGIPYYDSILKTTIMPFHFTEKYLRLLLDELSRQDKLLGHILVDGILNTQAEGFEISNNHLLGKLLVRNGVITEEQLEFALAKQKKTEEFLGNIIVENEFCNAEDLTESLNQQVTLRHYVHETFRHYVDKARLLSATQFTFKKYLEEWDVFLKKKSGKSIIELINYDRIYSPKSNVSRYEKLLIMIIIMNCLQKLNRRWNLTEQRLVEEKRFYELLDLVADEVMSKEDLIDLFVDDDPDYASIAYRLNKKQDRMDLSKSYKFIKRSNPNIREINDVPRWAVEAMEIKNILPEDSLAYLPLDDIAFYELGDFHEPLPVESSVHLKMEGNLVKTFKDSLLALWIEGVEIQWEKMYAGESFNKVAIPAYPFNRKSFWLPGNKTREIADARHRPDKDIACHDNKIISKFQQLENRPYSRIFSINDSIIRDHVITGTSIIPGASLIELGLEATRKVENPQINSMQNITIHNPGIVEKEISLNVDISSESKKISIQHGPLVLCSCKYSVTKEKLDTSIDLSGYTNSQPQNITGLYPLLGRIGYQYGKVLHVIRNMWRSDRGWLFELKSSGNEEGLMTSLSPIILDGIFQSALAVEYLKENLPESNTLLVPYYIKSLTVSGEIKDRCFVHFANEDIIKKGEDLNARFHVFDVSGKCIMLIKDMLFKRVSNQFLSGYSQTASGSSLKQEQSNKIYLYEPRWIKQGLCDSVINVSGHSAILFMDGGNLSKQLSRKLTSQYQKVFFIKKGHSLLSKGDGSFEINTKSEQDYFDVAREIFSQMTGNSSKFDIYYLWAYEPEPVNISNPLDLKEKNEKGVQGLFFLAKALIRLRIKDEVRILIASNEIHVVEPQDKGKGYYSGGLWGFIKTVMQENSKIKIKIVDFDNKGGASLEMSDILARECVSAEPVELAAYRKNGRYVRAIASSTFTNNKQASVLKDKGVYIITGGAGGIGLKVAAMIAREVNARLVLLDICELTPEKQKTIEELNKSGSEALYFQGDLTSLDRMKELMKTIKAQYGAVNGVIHGGGALEDKILVKKDWESFQRVMAPKVQGTWIINQLTQSEPLDFFVVFSSIVSIIGNAGQADYATANNFLDSFIHFREQNNYPGKSISVNWTLWADGGMGIHPSIIKSFNQKTGVVNSIPAIDALRQILNDTHCQCIIAGNSHYFKSNLQEKKQEAVKGSVEHGTNNQPENNTRDSIKEVQKVLMELLAEILQVSVSEFDANVDSREFGLDSITLTEYSEKINDHFDISIDPTLLFELPSIQALSEHIIQNYSIETEAQDIVEEKIESDCVPEALKVEEAHDNIGGIKQVLLELLAEILQISVSEFDSSMDLRELGLDSIALTEYSEKINGRFNISIDPTILFEIPSISDLSGYILENYSEVSEFLNTSKENMDSQSYASDEALEIPGIINKSPAAVEKQPVEFVEDGLLNSRMSTISSANFPTNESQQDIAVIGMSGRFPGSRDLDEFWKHLEAGDDLISEIPEDRFDWREFYGDSQNRVNKMNTKWGGFIDDIDKFDPQFFNISPKEASLMDPQQRILLETVCKTIEDAGCKSSDLAGTNTGVFVGVCLNDYSELMSINLKKIEAYVSTGSLFSAIPNRISYQLNLNGPSEAIDTACSSSLVALHRALQAIKNGNCEMAIVGGVNALLSPKYFISFSEAGMLSPDGRCKTFSSQANGYVRGEGVGAVLLKPLSKALGNNDHIYAIIKGVDINHGGHANSFTAPNPNAQAGLIKSVYEKANVDPETVTFIEAHGTGTSLGDPIEINGLKKAFSELLETFNKETPKKHYCGLGSVKTNIGHLESAAGIAGLIKLILSMKNRTLPASLHCREVNPYINLEGSPFYIVKDKKEWHCLKDKNNNLMPRRAGISSFGIGGANAHVIVEEFQGMSPERPLCDNEPQIIALSARNEDRLKAYAKEMKEFLERRSGSSIKSQSDVKSLKQKLPEELSEIASEILSVNVDEIGPDDEFTTFGFDTFKLSEFANRINEKFNLNLSVSLFSHCISIDILSRNIIREFKEVMCKFYPECSPEIDEVKPEESNLRLADIAFTLQTGRDSMNERLAMVVSSIEEIIDKLSSYCEGKSDIENLFTGSIKKSKEKSELLMDGEEGREFIKIIMANRKLAKLARLWADGVDIDWEFLHTKGRSHRISLPTYPFVSNRYWIPSKADQERKFVYTPEISHKGFRPLHPLVDVNESTLEAQLFKKTLKVEEYFLKDHIVGDRILLPGVAYLEMARAAGELSLRDSIHCIQDVIWARPILMDGVEERDINIGVYPENEHITYEIFSNEGQDRVVYSHGKISNNPALVNEIRHREAERIPLQDIRKRCAAKWEKDEIYRYFKNYGFHYGPRLRMMQEAYSGEMESLVKVEISDELLKDFPSYILHPSLMDAALGASIWIGKVNPDLDSQIDELSIPFALRRMDIIKPLAEVCYVYAFITPENYKKQSKIKIFNFIIADENGNELVRINDFSMQPVKGRSASPSVGKKKILEKIMYYQPIWEKIPLTNQTLYNAETPAKENMPGRIDQLIVFDSVKERYIDNIDQVVHVSPAASYKKLNDDLYQINPENPDDYKKLFYELKSQGINPANILHLWSFDMKPLDLSNLSTAKKTRNIVDSYLIKSIYSILYIFQSITDIENEVNTKCLFVSQCINQPQYEAISGFANALTAVNHRFKLFSLQIDSDNANKKQLSEVFINELSSPDNFNGIDIRYINEERFVRNVKLVEEVAGGIGNTSIQIKPDGVYLITGGAGGLGMIFAEYLAGKYKATLILAGRSDINQAKEEKINKLKSMGSEVVYYKADVSKYEDVKTIIEKIKSKFSAIDGIIHSAGALGVPVMQADKVDFEKTLLSKIHGTINLDISTQNEDLDFFVMFSSVSALFGDFGTCSYSTANRFMDGYSEYREQLRLDGKRNGRTLSINWPLWEEGGMQIPEEESDLYFKFGGMTTIKTEDGIHAFENALKSSLPQFIIASGNVDKINRILRIEESEVKTEPEINKPQVNKAQIQELGLIEKGEHNVTSNDDLYQKTETYLKGIISQSLEMPAEDIDPDCEFEEYGITSIMIMEILKLLEKDFGSLPKTIFFEYTNFQDLATYFVEKRSRKVNEIFGLSETSGVISSTQAVGTQQTKIVVPEVRASLQNIPGSAEELSQRAEAYLKGIISQSLEMHEEDLDADSEFEEFGITSIMIMEILKILEKDFGSLSKTIFFEHTNLHDLTEYFVANHSQKLSDIIGISRRDNAKPSSEIIESSPAVASTEIINYPSSPSNNSRFSNQRREKTVIANDAPSTPLKEEEIAIIGVSGRFPMANNLNEFWENLKEGKNCIIDIPEERWDSLPFYDTEKNKPGKTTMKWGGFMEDIDKFDPLLFNISPKEAEIMDPQERLFLEIVWETLEDAGYTREALSDAQSDEDKRVGVFAGSMFRHYQYLFARDIEIGSFMSVNSYSGIANRVSYHFNFRGPSISIDTACSASLTAVHMACGSIRSGQCGMAIAGGVNLTLHPYKYLGLDQFGLLGSQGKSMSMGQGDGYVPGEGVGAVLLKPLSLAIENGDQIYGVIKASAVNHGGKTSGISLPNPIAHAELMSKSFKKSRIDPISISYVESAANGAAIGDPIEIAGLDKAFKQHTDKTQFCAIGTVKSNIGHLEAASGISQLIKVLLQLKHKKLVPTINAEPLNPDINLSSTPFYLQKELEEWKRPKMGGDDNAREYPRRATISSFGALGANAHMVLEEYNGLKDRPDRRNNEPQIFILSAKNEERLKVYAEKIMNYLGNNEDIANDTSLADIAFTLQIGREPMEERLAIIAKTDKELIDGLKIYLKNPGKAARNKNVFIGKVNKSHANIYSLTKGQLGEDIVNLVIEHRELSRIAVLWVEGVNIPWGKLHTADMARRVSLPTYPFDKRRCWIDDISQDALADNQSLEIETEARVESSSQVAAVSQAGENVSTQDMVITDLKQMIMNMTKLSEKDIDVERNLLDYGLESIALRTLLTKINKRYNIEITPADFFENSSISEFTQFLLEGYEDRVTQYYSNSDRKANPDEDDLLYEDIISQHKIDLDISDIIVRRAVTEEDIETVYQVRWMGYEKYFNDISEVRDECDRDPNSLLFLATDKKGNPIGTMRLLDRRYGNIELDSFIDVDSALPEDNKACVEGTRLSIPLSANSTVVRYALYKAYFNYCIDNQIPTMILSAVPLIAKDYISLLFEDAGEKGIYYHEQLGGKEHRTYTLDVSNAKALYKEKEHPLYSFLFEEKHSNITYVTREERHIEYTKILDNISNDEVLQKTFNHEPTGVFLQSIPEDIVVRKARIEEDYGKILDLRRAVYGDIKGNSGNMFVVQEESDTASNATLLLAEDEMGNAVGTMKILNRKHGKIELDEYVDVATLLSGNENPCAEATRLCIPQHPRSPIIRLLLWKAFYLYCQVNQIKTWLISVSPDAVNYHKYLHFESIGAIGVFNHPGFGNLERHTLKLNVNIAEKIWEEKKLPIYDFMCRDFQRNISMEGYMH